MNLKYLFKNYLVPSIILHLLICGKSENACAQSYSYEIQTIPLKGEFINFSGTSILQDSDGFMWFGSREGLSQSHQYFSYCRNFYFRSLQYRNHLPRWPADV